MLCSLIVLIKGADSKLNYMLFICTSALWISLVNSTKIPAGDLVNYIDYYRNVANKTFFDNIFQWDEDTSKEPLYGIYNYVMYYITFGNERLFLFLTSLLDYVLLYYSLWLVYSKSHIPKGGIICGILAITFFTQLFTLSLHLVRQILATAVFMYALTLKSIDHKNHWILMICATMIHTATVLLVAISFIPCIYNYIRPIKLLLLILIFAIFLSFNALISTMIGTTSVEMLNYGIHRFGSSVADFTEGVSLPILIIIIMPGILICLKTIIALRKKHTISPLYPFIYLFIFLSVFVLSFFSMPLLQYRSFMLMYPLIPFIYPICFTKSTSISKIYWISVSIILFLRFLKTYNHAPFEFASIGKIIMSPIFGYF